MIYYIAVFASRTHSMIFNDELRKNGVSSSVIDTPREASVGCGLSVKFSPGDFEKVRVILSSLMQLRLKGFFKVREEGAMHIVTRL